MTPLKEKKSPNEKKQGYNFEILCYDIDGESHFGNSSEKLLTFIYSSTKLFSKKLQIENNKLISEDKSLTVEIDFIEDKVFANSFFVRSHFEAEKDTFDESNIQLQEFSEFRKKLTKYLTENGKIGKIFITRDDFSRFALSAVYPRFYSLENLLRSYLTKFFTKKYGPKNWLEYSLDNNVDEKVSKRKNNEDIFSSNNIHTKIFLIDTDDLGNIIYKNSSSNGDLPKLIKKIEDAKSLPNLQDDIRSNIDKHFNNFKEIGFQEKWQGLKKYRNKIAHNSLTDFEETITTIKHIDVLFKFLTNLDREIFKLTINKDIEKEDRIDLSADFNKINTNQMLDLLSDYNRWCYNAGREFLGLKNFMYNWIGSKGFDLSSAWEILETLEKNGKIKIGMWKDKNSLYPDQKMIVLSESFFFKTQ